MADVLANRETETLKARVWPLKHYIMWCVQSHQQPFPVDEKVFYKYLRELRDNNARAGKATCLTKAMAFLGHMFDVSSARAASRSKRVQGAAFVQLAGGATREGRSPFTVDQLRALQRGVSCLPAESDRIICGTVCALVACRTRYQDLQRSVEEPVLDKAEDAPTYLEVRLGRTKTTNKARSLLSRRVAAGHADGLDGDEWATAWLEARKKAGRDAKIDKCLLPAYSPSEGWLRRRMRNDEFNRNLKRLLTILGGPPKENNFWGVTAQRLHF